MLLYIAKEEIEDWYGLLNPLQIKENLLFQVKDSSVRTGGS